MVATVVELRDLIEPSMVAEDISYKYTYWGQKRDGKEREWMELRNYLFATDTTTTSNSQLPWKNKTTLPKLTQIRDNLHANYMSALFPNPEWLVWEGHSIDGVTKAKAQTIQDYMRNKVRISGFQKVISRLLYDYIDYGNAIADVEYVHEKHKDPITEEEVDGYIGPRAVRKSPFDIVFNPAAPSFEDSPKITRTILSMGELKEMAETRPEMKYSTAAIEHAEEVRRRIAVHSRSDNLKTDGYQMDGFDSIHDYYESGYVEVLEFQGTLHDEFGNLMRNRIITIIDRSHIVRNEPNPAWNGSDGMSHVAWRMRPDNLYGMGPLDNLVGMQYRIDHLENIKADLFDLIAHPPLKIKGNVEAFDWAPFAQIFLGDDGEIDILKVDATALQADSQIAILEQKMEEFAGAPREAMGIRSPGEKTAFEVQKLDDAAGRIFQEKIRQFEIFVMEPLLNNMLESARRNMNAKDVIRTIDDDLGVVRFMDITRSDISSQGFLRAKGAQHFAARNLLIQNLTQVFNSPIGELISPHTSRIKLSKLVEEAFGWERFELFKPNIAVQEQQQTDREVNSAQDQLEQEQLVAATEPLSEEDIPPG